MVGEKKLLEKSGREGENQRRKHIPNLFINLSNVFALVRMKFIVMKICALKYLFVVSTFTVFLTNTFLGLRTFTHLDGGLFIALTLKNNRKFTTTLGFFLKPAIKRRMLGGWVTVFVSIIKRKIAIKLLCT